MPPEILEKLRLYQSLLLKWQKTINLVSPSTLKDAWTRHFEDSLQITDLVPQTTKTVWDLGSGAGFPGLVLAIARPDLSVNLVESDVRKSAFLQNVSRETLSGNVHVRNGRLEDMLDILPPPDMMTARAFAPLTKILQMTRPVWEANPHLVFLLPKGRSVDQEITDAQGHFTFVTEKKPSVIDPESCILIVSNIRAA